MSGAFSRPRVCIEEAAAAYIYLRHVRVREVSKLKVCVDDWSATVLSADSPSPMHVCLFRRIRAGPNKRDCATTYDTLSRKRRKVVKYLT